MLTRKYADVGAAYKTVSVSASGWVRSVVGVAESTRRGAVVAECDE
jgi:hypothetical protein